MTDPGLALDGRWLEWQGLPSGTTEQGLLAALRARPEAVTRRAVRLASRQFDVGQVALQSNPSSARWWQRDGQVELLELVDPLCVPSLDEVLVGLGKPEREGAGRFLTLGGSTTEYVWPSRGLALTVAESYDDPPSFAPRLASAQLFEPTTMRDFVIELGGNDRGGPSW